MRRYLSLFMSCMLIGLFCMVLVVMAQTQCPSACTCMLPSDAAKMKGYSLCGGKQIICGYDKEQNPLYCYQKPATTTTTQATVVTASPSTCPSSCTCLLPSEAKVKGYGSLCGGKQVLCGYDQNQNQKFCYEKPATTVPTVTTTKPTTTPTTFPVTTCPTPCACLLPDDAKKMGYTFCGGKQTLCGYDNDKSPLYCYSLSATPTTVPSTRTVTPMETTRTTHITTQTVTNPEITRFPTPPPVTTVVLIVASGEDVEPTALETAPLLGISQQEQQRGGIGGFFTAIMSFFSSIFGRSTPTQSSSLQRVPCNGVITDIMTDPDNCGSCGVACDSGSCVAGRCTDESGRMGRCGPLQIQCDGTCTHIMTDEENCGVCGNVCLPPFSECCDGQCIQPCDPGETCIEGGCHNTSSDSLYCGEGWERCDYPSVCCGGACRNFNDDEQNCGECGEVCDSDYTCCNGNCVDVSGSSFNCGECGHRCPVDELCCDGVCCNTSLRGIICCSSGCTDIYQDEQNCGRCGDRCTPGAECIEGTCLWSLYLVSLHCNDAQYQHDHVLIMVADTDRSWEESTFFTGDTETIGTVIGTAHVPSPATVNFWVNDQDFGDLIIAITDEFDFETDHTHTFARDSGIWGDARYTLTYRVYYQE